MVAIFRYSVLYIFDISDDYPAPFRTRLDGQYKPMLGIVNLYNNGICGQQFCIAHRISTGWCGKYI